MERERKLKRAKEREKTRGDWGRGPGVQIVERERKLKRAKEREKTRGDWGRGRGNACEIFSKEAVPVY